MRFLLSLLRGWAVSLLIWGAFFTAMGWQLVHVLPVTWATAFQTLGRDALIWAFVTPLVFLLSQKLPLERVRWKTALPAHAAACLVTLACFGMFSQRGPVQREPEPARPGEPRPRGPMPPPRAWNVGWIFFGPQLPMYLALVGAAHAASFYRRAQERERRALELDARLAEARLHALRMQIQPHFLFNSLNALAALIHKDPDAADEMLAGLAAFLRLTLEEATGQETELGRELEFARHYLAIEQVRFGERLRYVIDVPAELHGGRLPALALQPIIENAVRHGIESRTESGVVSVRAERQGDRLIVTVEDNGPGFADSVREGVGLRNTRSRLHELYGDGASLSWKSEGGTQVEIAVPWRTA